MLSGNDFMGRTPVKIATLLDRKRQKAWFKLREKVVQGGGGKGGGDEGGGGEGGTGGACGGRNSERQHWYVLCGGQTSPARLGHPLNETT